MPPVVLHIDTEKGFRGGQQQALYLHTELLRQGYRSYFAYPKDSLLEPKLDRANSCAYQYRNELDFLSGYRLALFARKHQINILHAHSGHALSVALLTRLFYPHCKVIASRRVDFRIHGGLSRVKYNKADRIVCISQEIERVMLDCGIPQRKLTVIHSGVDLERFSASEADRSYLPENLRGKRIVGIVAALAGHKDYPNLIGAAEIILKNNPDVIFVSLGDGPEREKVNALAGKAPLRNRFIFLGHRNDVGGILKSFDIFVMSSRKEGLGTSIIDAMAQGLPIVATDAGGIPELIQDRDNGLLVPRQNSQELAKGIQTLLDDPRFATTLGEKARQDSAKHSMQNMARRNYKLYLEMVGK